jgi:glycosyltransferase involved in cell wall biosynthesis
VDLLALDREATQPVTRTGHDAVFSATQGSGWRFLVANLKSLLSGDPYTRFVYDSLATRGELVHCLAGQQYSLVHVDSIDLVGYLPYLGQTPFTLTHHNTELLVRQAAGSRIALQRSYLRLQARRVAHAERRWASAAALNIVVSREDEATLRHHAPRARTAVVPNGVDAAFFTPGTAPAVGPKVVFLGGLDYRPNRDGVEWMLREIEPRIRAAVPGSATVLIGAASPADFARLGGVPNVHLTGYVPDIRPVMREATCAVVPLLTGGGTRVKILTAWAMGLPVVSTSLGCEGLAFEDGTHGFIRDDPAEFAAAVVDLLGSPERAHAMGLAARTHVVSRYSWQALLSPLREIYSGLLGG